MGTLFLIATPIGNLEDITVRALDTLRGASLVLAEDTRVTKRLLTAHKIEAPLIRFDEYAPPARYDEVVRELGRGARIALVTDAGTPAIADPGWKLVRYVRKKLPDVLIVPVPGPSSIATALSAAGIPADTFTFAGFPPQKKGRATFFRELSALTFRPVVLFESPHRIIRTLAELGNALGETHEIIVARELTKLHEELWSGTLLAAREHFTGTKGRGEFVLILP
jgi:16S rRNA (cytidine1402-2'-O)-methyltransferase